MRYNITSAFIQIRREYEFMVKDSGKWIIRIIKKPFDDYFVALNSCLARVELKNIIAIVTTLLISWWVYVPIHELLHAFGCIAGGGQVSRLEIAPVYGAGLLEKVFPFVTSGSKYAGRLSGFDTKGSDLVYLLTDFFPYLLTIVIGIPLLKSVSNRNASPFIKSIVFGFSIPFAYAPFISITGDYYEMGSIIVSGYAAKLLPGAAPERWRSDDVFNLIERLFFSGAENHVRDILVVAMSFLLGIILIYATYWAGTLCSAFIPGKYKPKER